jgi:hypothetical protein
MKKNYILPEVEIIKLNAADIITASLVAANNENLTDALLADIGN